MRSLTTVLLAAAFSAAAFEAASQEGGEAPKFRFGLKGSPSLAWMKPDSKEYESSGGRIKFAYGLITEFSIAKNYSFITGLDVSYSGGGLDFLDTAWYFVTPGDSSTFFLLNSRKYNLQYIDLPLLLKMKTNEIGYLTYYGQFGFNLAVNIKSRAEDRGKLGNGVENLREDVDIIKDINFLRTALNLGLGVEYNIAGNTSLVIGLNYNNGFSNVMRKESKALKNKSDQPLEQKAVSNFISLTVGVLF